jgi:FKBP-type peptidyl-prolyl cis-trans isomerase
VLTSGASLTCAQSASAAYEDFFTTSSGLKILDLIANPESSTPVSKGDTVRVHYSGYTLGYQAKRFENTSLSDEPFVFTIGGGDAIPAFVRRSLAHAPSRNPGVSCHRR